ncbi:MAG: VPLPA-CTERM sorting domain-containing protein [Albidovulum sp.]
MSLFIKPAAVALAMMIATPSDAATYNFTLDTVAGTFDAPVGGGVISAFSVTLGGALFSTLGLGAAAPVYNPILNTLTNMMDVEFRGVGQTTGHVFNSTASGQCPIGQCALQLFDTIGGIQPPEYLAFNTVTFQNVAFGFYAIDPNPVGAAVPLPASAWLMGLGLAGLGFGARRKKHRDT